MTAWIDILPRAVLSVTTDTTLFVFLVCGFYTRWHSIIVRSTLVILMGLLFNFFLKSLWQVPLDPALHVNEVNWAFPSGHTALAMTLYVWLGWETRRPLWIILAYAWVLTIGSSLVYFHYHNWAAVFGAVGFTTLFLVAYEWLNRPLRPTDWPIIGLVFSVLGMMIIYSLLPYRVNWLWKPEGMLVGFALGLWMNQRYVCGSGLTRATWHESWEISGIKIVMGLIGCYALYAICNYFLAVENNPFVLFFQYLVMTLWYTVFVDQFFPYLSRMFTKR
jgi:hypothetical protein